MPRNIVITMSVNKFYKVYKNKKKKKKTNRNNKVKINMSTLFLEDILYH